MSCFQRLAFVFLFCFAIDYAFSQTRQLAVDYVNSYIGTAWDRGGGTIPTVGPPYAMTSFTAQTRENIISAMPYIYEDSTIMGFIGTHQPMLWMGDYGYVSVMPVAGDLKVYPNERSLAFKHEDEVVSPYYYSVKMRDREEGMIAAEMASTSRCAILKFEFPKGAPAHIVIQGLNISDSPDPEWLHWISDLNSRKNREEQMEGYISVDLSRNEITGYNPDHMSYNISPQLKNFKGYFVIQFDQPIQTCGTWQHDRINPMTLELKAKKQMGAYASFDMDKTASLSVKVATSFISVEQARENLKREIPGWRLQDIAEQTKNIWEENLETFEIKGVSEEQKRIFYTALYHTMLFPREMSEYGKYYSAFDDKVHFGSHSYTDFSLWDTFRALHPLMVFLQPERTNHMITSMLQSYKEGGRLPMWPNPAETNIMIGTHADNVIADAYVKGLRDYDVELAYEAMRKNALVPPDFDVLTRYSDRENWATTHYEARAGLSYYHSLGYVPQDKTDESVSRTLEYALNDYCVAQMAKALGHTADYERMMEWSKNYKNLYNSETGFMAPRRYDGRWHDRPWEGFTEGGPWTYLFCVMQDVPGLIQLMGGDQAFANRLDSNFINNHYVHENEPGHHYIYLYNYCGQSWKTQELVRKYTRSNYLNAPNGIFGNDDCGQMSAWYIFSTMGFYPVTPASGKYAIGAPQFPEMTMRYRVNGENRSLRIIAENLSDANLYVQEVKLDGKLIETPFLDHQELIQAKELKFTMGNKPKHNWN
ncbi:alpha-1,2-mannosidase, putative [Parapedobacter composti]|uniref:Alpha-1,2-mannosidase, putative n=2 Tax=Parapedobacter composti TaxID=623281 RepID=A0A1I1KVY7_9SPHI|nr:alpha-1,2-mannosidase, putative [Parapedobacter composti]